MINFKPEKCSIKKSNWSSQHCNLFVLVIDFLSNCVFWQRHLKVLVWPRLWVLVIQTSSPGTSSLVLLDGKNTASFAKMNSWENLFPMMTFLYLFIWAFLVMTLSPSSYRLCFFILFSLIWKHWIFSWTFSFYLSESCIFLLLVCVH